MILTAHCFWAWCPHTEVGIDPGDVHAAMEEHYAAEHAADLERVV